MKCNNTLLIKDTSIVLKDNECLYRRDLPSSILRNGVIVNTEKFYEEYLKLITSNKLSKIFWNKDLKIIYNALNNKKDVINIYNLFKDLNYRIVNMCSEKDFIKINNKCNYLVVDKYLRLFYIDNNNSKKLLVLDEDVYYTHEIKQLILNRCKNRELFIIGNFCTEYISEKIDYYYFENFDEFFLENKV